MTRMTMPSITHALKAQKLLRSAGYTCEVQKQKTNPQEGCVFSLTVNAPVSELLPILEHHRITYDNIREG